MIVGRMIGKVTRNSLRQYRALELGRLVHLLRDTPESRAQDEHGKGGAAPGVGDADDEEWHSGQEVRTWPPDEIAKCPPPG